MKIKERCNSIWGNNIVYIIYGSMKSNWGYVMLLLLAYYL